MAELLHNIFYLRRYRSNINLPACALHPSIVAATIISYTGLGILISFGLDLQAIKLYIILQAVIFNPL